ncbi:hypothetical protein [Phocaeicola salanitronis]|jgi:transcriptional regulator NrdR family protein|uniref:hypothetical protein n=1 Tax=Phocaeicola salanitronis TaxID=376805 RepID=UPI00320ABFF1
MERNSVFLVYTLIEQSESVSDCHVLYATLERAKDAMDREIEEARENFDKGKVLHDLERLYEFRTEDGYGFTVGIDEMKPL